MGFFSKLFGKDKKKRSELKGFFDLYEDGQSQYFKKGDDGAKDATKAENKQANDRNVGTAEASANVKAAPKSSAKASGTAKNAKAEEVASAKEKPSKKAEKASEDAKPKAKKTSAPKAKADKKDAQAKASDASDTVSDSEQNPEAKKTGRFEIKKAKDGRFVFNLYAPNSVIVATSQTYTSAASAINGIESIILNARRAALEDQSLKNKPEPKNCPKWEIYIDNGGQYRFRLNAPNGSCIVHSQGYTTKAACKNGIDSIIRCSVNPEIDKSYLKKS